MNQNDNLNPKDNALKEFIEATAQQINPNPVYQSELEKRLINAHKPRTGFILSSPKQFASMLGWAVVIVLLVFGFTWMLRALNPGQMPASNNATPVQDIIIDSNTPRPVEDKGGYDFRGSKLYITQPLPESPAEANVYLLKEDQHATADEARALADRFGIQGEIYTTTGQLPNTTDYVISDGKQMLTVRSNRYFTYTSDIVKSARNFNGMPNDNAEGIIHEFLKARGMDFPFSISTTELRGGYSLRLLMPNGIPMQYEFFSPPVMRVTLDENGEVLNVEASLMDYDPTPVGTYSIITAQEALDKLLDDKVPAGKIESMHSGTDKSPQEWYRQYPDNQAVTVYGFVSSYPSVDSSKPPLILIDGVPARGNTEGLEKLDYYTFIEASGQYFVENGIRKFNVESWSADNVTQSYFPGYLDKYGDQTTLITATDDGTRVTYPITDLPPDVPLNTDPQKQELSVTGVIVDGKMFWTYIQFIDDMSGMGGGGGGGGIGFYKLNLSGAPIPFPTPTMVPGSADNNGYAYTVVQGDTCQSIAEAFRVPAEKLIVDNNLPEDCSTLTIGQTIIINANIPAITRLDGARGMLNVNLYSNGDGTMRAEYGFITSKAPNLYLLLEGEDLQELQGYNNKPVEIWGSVTRINQYDAPVIRVEKYNIPFPDLKPQIMKGTEKSMELEGKNAVLFTAEDGTVYAEFMPGCNDLIPVESMAGTKGGNAANGDKSVLVEALAVPDLSFAGYPGICVFQTAPATQANGDPMKLTITSDQPSMMPESPATSSKPPKLTVDQVELVYFVSNPQYQANDPTASERSPYIQPAWHFHGHYESGDEFDVIVQALKQEFLSPELDPYVQGG